VLSGTDLGLGVARAIIGASAARFACQPTALGAAFHVELARLARSDA
jgi:hypothetical protein